jgi:hypothetical protein
MNLGKVGKNSYAVAGQKKHLNFALPLSLSINPHHFNANPVPAHHQSDENL